MKSFDTEEFRAPVLELKTRLCKKTDGTYDHGPFHVDTRLRTVQCGTCGADLNAAWVLAEIASAERPLIRRIERLQQEVRDLTAKTITTCEHCLNPTKITR